MPNLEEFRADHSTSDIHRPRVGAELVAEEFRADQPSRDTLIKLVGAEPIPFVDAGHKNPASHKPCACIDEIIELWRQRQAWHRAEKTLTLQAKAICRRFAGGDKKEAEKIYKLATAALANVPNGLKKHAAVAAVTALPPHHKLATAAIEHTLNGHVDVAAVADATALPPQHELATAATLPMPNGHAAFAAVAIAIAPIVEARDTIKPRRLALEKHLSKLAETLPVWPALVKGVRGVGSPSLAAIVGECGDLANYSNPAKLWKRMGLAVIDGGRQRKVAGAIAELHGYNPARHAVAWNISDSIIKVGGPTSPYRTLYDERKLLEASRVTSKAHAHNRAARYMVKRFLRDLWKAWKIDAQET